MGHGVAELKYGPTEDELVKGLTGIFKKSDWKIFSKGDKAILLYDLQYVSLHYRGYGFNEKKHLVNNSQGIFSKIPKKNRNESLIQTAMRMADNQGGVSKCLQQTILKKDLENLLETSADEYGILSVCKIKTFRVNGRCYRQQVWFDTILNGAIGPFEANLFFKLKKSKTKAVT